MNFSFSDLVAGRESENTRTAIKKLDLVDDNLRPLATSVVLKVQEVRTVLDSIASRRNVLPSFMRGQLSSISIGLIPSVE